MFTLSRFPKPFDSSEFISLLVNGLKVIPKCIKANFNEKPATLNIYLNFSRRDWRILEKGVTPIPGNCHFSFYIFANLPGTIVLWGVEMLHSMKGPFKLLNLLLKNKRCS